MTFQIDRRILPATSGAFARDSSTNARARGGVRAMPIAFGIPNCAAFLAWAAV
jgi:hypothetical protein